MSDTKCVFRWTDLYKVNVALLDQQHQGLFDTVNELERALRVGEGNAVIDGILDRLVTYAGLHFAAEESLIDRHSFQGLPTHRIQHEMFRKKMTTHAESCESVIRESCAAPSTILRRRNAARRRSLTYRESRRSQRCLP